MLKHHLSSSAVSLLSLALVILSLSSNHINCNQIGVEKNETNDSGNPSTTDGTSHKPMVMGILGTISLLLMAINVYFALGDKKKLEAKRIADAKAAAELLKVKTAAPKQVKGPISMSCKPADKALSKAGSFTAAVGKKSRAPSAASLNSKTKSKVKSSVSGALSRKVSGAKSSAAKSKSGIKSTVKSAVKSVASKK